VNQESYIEVVRRVLQRMSLLNAAGGIVQLDSLTVIDLVIELETDSGVEIPTTALRAESFASVESLAQLIAELAAQAR